MMTENELIDAIMGCFSNGNPEHCYHASVANTGRLNAVQTAMWDRNGVWWFSQPGNSITLGGMTFPLSTEMVLCDTHVQLAREVWGE